MTCAGLGSSPLQCVVCFLCSGAWPVAALRRAAAARSSGGDEPRGGRGRHRLTGMCHVTHTCHAHVPHSRAPRTRVWRTITADVITISSHTHAAFSHTRARWKAACVAKRSC